MRWSRTYRVGGSCALYVGRGRIRRFDLCFFFLTKLVIVTSYRWYCLPTWYQLLVHRSIPTCVGRRAECALFQRQASSLPCERAPCETLLAAARRGPAAGKCSENLCKNLEAQRSRYNCTNHVQVRYPSLRTNRNVGNGSVVIRDGRRVPTLVLSTPDSRSARTEYLGTYVGWYQSWRDPTCL